MKQHEKNETQKNCYSASRKKRCNMKRMQYEKRCNMERVQEEKSITRTAKVKPEMSATRKVCNTKKMQHEKSAT